MKNNEEYISVDLKVSALVRMLQQHDVCASDMHCKSPKHKALLQRLMLDALSKANTYGV